MTKKAIGILTKNNKNNRVFHHTMTIYFFEPKAGRLSSCMNALPLKPMQFLPLFFAIISWSSASFRSVEYVSLLLSGAAPDTPIDTVTIPSPKGCAIVSTLCRSCSASFTPSISFICSRTRTKSSPQKRDTSSGYCLATIFIQLHTL